MTALRILAFSDLHGGHYQVAQRLIRDLAPDWIVLAGDMLPDFYAIGNDKRGRLEAQRTHWQSHRRSFFHPDTVTTFILGNHEIEGFEDLSLRTVHPSLTDKVGILEGNPIEFGAWGWSREWEEEDLQAEVDFMRDPLIVLSHVPPYGVRDRTAEGKVIGHRPLAVRLRESNPPALVICGHVHESFGATKVGDTLVVNAATGYALISWDPEARQAEVLHMERLSQVSAKWKMEEEDL